MAAPTLTKSYSFLLNQRSINTGSSYQNCLATAYAMKVALTSATFGANALVVKGSAIAGGSAYAVGGASPVDYWVNSTLSGGNSGASPYTGTWIVLQFPATGAQLLLQASTNNAAQTVMNLRYSPGGLYTGGSNSTMPTATDEITLASLPQGFIGAAQPYNPTLTTTNDTVINCIMSSDGKDVMLMAIQNTALRSLFGIKSVTNGVTNWTTPSIFFYGHSGGTYSTLSSTTTLYTRLGGVNLGLYPTGEIFGTTSVTALALADEDNSTFPAVPVGGMCFTAPRRGRKFQVTDLWWGASTGEGATYPADGSKQFAQFGELIFPWDGATTPQMV